MQLFRELGVYCDGRGDWGAPKSDAGNPAHRGSEGRGTGNKTIRRQRARRSSQLAGVRLLDGFDWELDAGGSAVVGHRADISRRMRWN